MLRAILSGWVGRVRATSIAASIGRALAVAFGAYSLLVVFPPNWVHVALAAFIYFVAGAEESGVLAEERSRTSYQPQNQGIWTAPPGFHWVHRGNGVWQLAPIVVASGAQAATRRHGPVDACHRAEAACNSGLVPVKDI